MSASPSSIPSRRFLLNNFSSQSTISEWRSSASSSRIFRAYELSDELTRKQVQVLERRYGGRLRAHAAATRIQRAFREYRMMQQWRSLVIPLQQCVHTRSRADTRWLIDRRHDLTTSLIARDHHVRMMINASRSHKNNSSTASSSDQKTQFRCSAERVNCATAAVSNCWRSKFLMGTSEQAITTSDRPMTTMPLLEFPRAPRSGSDISRYASAVGVTASGCGLATRTATGTGQCAADRRLTDVTTNIVIGDDRRIDLARNNNKNNNSHKGMLLRHSDGVSSSVLPNRYHPSVSLSAQLRLNSSAINGNSGFTFTSDNNTSQELNSSSSVSRLIDDANNISGSSNRRPNIDKLMSPRLSHKRIVSEVVNSTNLSSSGATHQSSNNNIWVPRTSLCSAGSSHTNSLPRLDNHSIQCTNQRSTQSEICEQHRRRQYRIALNFFNKKPARGIQLLLNWGFVEENARSIAKLLIGRRGLSKQMIGEYLGHLHDPFHSSVLDHFINEIDLHSMEIDVALRHTLTFFRLPGEAQKIERIVQVFSRRYIICNPERASSFHGADTVFVLSFAIIMLNTDLHSPNIKPSKKMKLDDFIKNLRGVDAGFDLDRCLLTGIYERIREHEFRSGLDHVSQVIKLDHSIVGKDKPKLVEPQRRLVCYCRLNQIVDVNKRQTVNAHQRDVFLFNDIFLMTKMVSKKKSTSQYNLRMWSALIGMEINVFQTNFYRFGISIVCQDGEKILLNAKNDDDRHRFVADIRESIAECAEMETIRIECELEKRSSSNADVLPAQCASSQKYTTNSNMGTLTISTTGKAFELNKTATSERETQPSICSASLQTNHEHATTKSSVNQQQHNEQVFVITSNSQRDSGLPDNASASDNAVAPARLSCTSLNDDGVNELLQLLPTSVAEMSSKTFIAINEAAAFDAVGSTYHHNDKHQNFCCCSNNDNAANKVFIIGGVDGGSTVMNVGTSSIDHIGTVKNNSAVSSQRRLSFNSLDSGVIE